MELIREVLEVVKDLPDLAIWVLIGILFYKVVIVGSIFGIIKMAIEKSYNVFELKRDDTIEHDKAVLKSAYLQQLEEQEKKYRHEYTLDHEFICHDGTYEDFKSFLRLVKGESMYIHKNDVDFLRQAYKEKQKREKEKR